MGKSRGGDGRGGSDTSQTFFIVMNLTTARGRWRSLGEQGEEKSMKERTKERRIEGR